MNAKREKIGFVMKRLPLSSQRHEHLPTSRLSCARCSGNADDGCWRHRESAPSTGTWVARGIGRYVNHSRVHVQGRALEDMASVVSSRGQTSLKWVNMVARCHFKFSAKIDRVDSHHRISSQVVRTHTLEGRAHAIERAYRHEYEHTHTRTKVSWSHTHARRHERLLIRQHTHH